MKTKKRERFLNKQNCSVNKSELCQLLVCSGVAVENHFSITVKVFSVLQPKVQELFCHHPMANSFSVPLSFSVFLCVPVLHVDYWWKIRRADTPTPNWTELKPTEPYWKKSMNLMFVRDHFWCLKEADGAGLCQNQWKCSTKTTAEATRQCLKQLLLLTLWWNSDLMICRKIRSYLENTELGFFIAPDGV